MNLLLHYYLRSHRCRIVLYDYVEVEPIVLYTGIYTLGYLNNSIYVHFNKKWRHCVIVGE
jgi:hypothetical protein